MAKFDFSKSSIKSDEELNKSLEGGFKDRPYLDPGTYEVVIKEAKSAGQDLYDKSWEQMEVVFEDAGKKTIKTYLKVPTSDFAYNGSKSGKPSMMPFKRVAKVVTALTGKNLTKTNAGDVLTELFAKPEKALVGKSLKIQVGYDRLHVAYDGKDEIGTKKYVIKNGKTGATEADEKGKTLTFPSFDAAKAHAESHQISLQKYADILEFMPSATPATKANW